FQCACINTFSQSSIKFKTPSSFRGESFYFLNKSLV
ncbi:unnamed protein product, partial [Schistosoma curassoni]|uniref:Ovule protein n=1 Tax=Schistosoma curassoni TaxID=6186 RepID=A0A183JFX9_9TREM